MQLVNSTKSHNHGTRPGNALQNALTLKGGFTLRLVVRKDLKAPRCQVIIE
jgi:hypothetical protein